MTRRIRRAGLIGPAVLLVLASGCTYTDLASTANDGGQIDSAANFPSIDGTGRYVGFVSTGTDVVPGDTNGVIDGFVHDLVSGTTSRVTVATDGTQGNGQSQTPLLSSDGSIVVFTSQASNFVPGDQNLLPDVFERNLATGVTTLVSAGLDGLPAHGASLADGLSDDGRYVVFESTAANLAAGDSNGMPDVFVRDMATGTTTRADVDATGHQLAAGASEGSISADGAVVSFTSGSPDVVPGGNGGFPQIYVHQLGSGATTLVSAAVGSTAGEGASRASSLDGTGKHVLFESTADDLVAGDTNAVADIFERDLTTGSTTRVSVASDGTQADGASSLSYPQRRDLSDDGCRAAFQSDADNLSAGDANLSTDVFLHDCRSGQTTRVPFRANDAWGAHFGSGHAALSGDGGYVAFASRDALDVNDTDGHTDIYVRFTYPAAIPVAVSPSSVRPGTVARLTLTGHDFQWRSGVMFDRGITVLAEKWVSPTEIDLTVTVAADAATGAVRLIIANLGTGAGLQNGSGSYCTCLTVTS